MSDRSCCFGDLRADDVIAGGGRERIVIEVWSEWVVWAKCVDGMPTGRTHTSWDDAWNRWVRESKARRVAERSEDE